MKAIPEVGDVALAAPDEVLAVSQAESFDFTLEEAREVLFKFVAEDGIGNNKPSICADINNMRPTEFEVING